MGNTSIPNGIERQLYLLVKNKKMQWVIIQKHKTASFVQSLVYWIYDNITDLGAYDSVLILSPEC